MMPQPDTAQGDDVLGERGLPVEPAGEAEAGARGDVVDQLEHRRALVAGPLLAAHHVDRGEVAAALAQRQAVDAVGQHAHLHARAIERVVGADGVGPVDHVGLAGGAAGRRRGRVAGHPVGGGLVRRPHLGHLAATREGHHRIERHLGPHRAVGRDARHDRAAARRDGSEQRGGHLGIDVDEHRSGVGGDRAAELGRPLHGDARRVLLDRVEEVGVDLLLGGRPARLVVGDGLHLIGHRGIALPRRARRLRRGRCGLGPRARRGGGRRGGPDARCRGGGRPGFGRGREADSRGDDERQRQGAAPGPSPAGGPCLVHPVDPCSVVVVLRRSGALHPPRDPPA